MSSKTDGIEHESTVEPGKGIVRQGCGKRSQRIKARGIREKTFVTGWARQST